eukprot:CAMPEP_0181176276 /NCGR_PEP_ID=MMETSP1096-20121128/4541_1 /TAXON_ID=156174 ORGANISM="Chrysochromulina ericina, Strain CCMP281" /NCGR_SAMPLE_ID=MMETSP1096 /ASSEMBLY_ACC=CAM_ASM_000453 /LENGTH=131 /DNA_ID=CAMNT_0023264349 /DNA_START=27 /DNA_END=422 /DNA_ORIENTATION=+
MSSGTDCDGSQTPEELLLDAIGFMKSNKIERARANVQEARRVCNSNGGPTDDQTALLSLLDARLPPPKAAAPQPTLAEMFPGTQAAPTGSSLVMPGTPTFAELAANAKEKQDAKLREQREAQLREQGQAET